jgi:hypothetical protein
MLWVISAAVIAVLSLAIAVLWRRRRVVYASGVFRCRLRSSSWGLDTLTQRWSRHVSYAVWVHDVLVVYRGIALTRVVLFACRFAEDLEDGPAELRRLGPCPLLLRLRLDDGAIVEVAAPRRSCGDLVGPYVAAQLHPSERRSGR